MGPLPPARNERATAPRGTAGAPRGSAAADAGLSTEEQALIAAQRHAFDYEAASRAEAEREHEVLQALLMAFLKNEDEITKKWISLI